MIAGSLSVAVYSMIQLAIIIPCYKGTFLKTTLDALAFQSNKNFAIYIGDDNSKDDIENIVAPYLSKLNIVYKKFSANLGGTSLVKQWERSIELSKDEPWIWILPDDDYCDENCVSNFLNALPSFNTNLYRFNTKVVDGNNELFDAPCINPSYETGLDFIADKLMGNRRSSIAEYVFSRNIFEKKRIVEYPTAWCSDDATWLNFSEEKGIITINNCFVFVRISNESISGNTDKYNKPKIEACLQYLTFLKEKYFSGLSEVLYKKNTSFNEVTKKWFLIQLSNSSLKFSIIEKIKLMKRFVKIWNGVEGLKVCYFVFKRY